MKNDLLKLPKKLLVQMNSAREYKENVYDEYEKLLILNKMKKIEILK